MSDIVTDEFGTPLIADRDFFLGNTDHQIIQDILSSEKGWWREFPLVGVNLQSYLLAPSNMLRRNALTKEIKLQLVYDGFQVNMINLDNNLNPTINAKRK